MKHLVNSWYQGFVLLAVAAFFVVTTLGVFHRLPDSLQLAMAGGPDKAQVPGVLDANSVELLSIPRIGLQQPVLMAPTTDEGVFNELLLQGVVQYPGTGKIGEKRPIFLLGHSTRKNTPASRYYRYLNGLDGVRPGDTIELSGSSRTAVYEVVSAGVHKDHEVVVHLNHNTANLIIATCSRIGAKEDRVVVEAKLVRIL